MSREKSFVVSQIKYSCHKYMSSHGSRTVVVSLMDETRISKRHVPRISSTHVTRLMCHIAGDICDSNACLRWNGPIDRRRDRNKKPVMYINRRRYDVQVLVFMWLRSNQTPSNWPRRKLTTSCNFEYCLNPNHIHEWSESAG